MFLDLVLRLLRDRCDVYDQEISYHVELTSKWLLSTADKVTGVEKVTEYWQIGGILLRIRQICLC